jgi:nitroreductase
LDFKDVVRRRRMVRNYEDRRVSREAVSRIVDAARRAPSAGFSQGISFVVVTEPDTRRALAEIANEDEYAASGFDRWISKAPVHVAVCVDESAYHARYNEPDKVQEDGAEIEWPVPYWWVDAGAALMMLLLAAVDEGLAAGFFGVHRLGGLNEALGIPASIVPIGVVTIGHPAPDRPSGSLARGRRARTDSVRWERWE